MHQIHVNRALITVAVRTCRFAGLAGLGVPRRRYGHRGLRLAALAGVLAAFGIPGVWQSVAVASSSPVLNWTRQAPATSPPVLSAEPMAYDAATGSVVLFSGRNVGHVLGDTWTWDGSTWTKQAPATSPPARELASMAYDAATGNVVLFGGDNFEPQTFNDTWTWGSG
jgi:hypothetical protein